MKLGAIHATNDTILINMAALLSLKRIFKPGYSYKKAGVMLMELMPDNIRQGQLFAEPDVKSERVMRVMDALNQDFGKNTLYLGACAIRKRWSTLFEYRMPRYTAKWYEVPKVIV
jgi:DNA polymerase V